MIQLHWADKGDSQWQSGWIDLPRIPMVGEYLNPRWEIGICKVIRVLHTPLEEAHTAEIWAVRVSDEDWQESLRSDL